MNLDEFFNEAQEDQEAHDENLRDFALLMLRNSSMRDDDVRPAAGAPVFADLNRTGEGRLLLERGVSVMVLEPFLEFFQIHVERVGQGGSAMTQPYLGQALYPIQGGGGSQVA